ncbi:MAG: hypothetical protein IJ054_03800 [Lachnospiraceae bacterium]|nr:hypothetical protein [Lachnospiraceae bacterium]
MLENDNMEGKNKIDDTILNILKGNIKAEDAIREEQLEKVERIFDDDSSENYGGNDITDDSDDIGLINFDGFGDRSELGRGDSYESDDYSLGSGLSSRDEYSESNYGSRGQDSDLKYGLRDRSEFDDIDDEEDRPTLGLNIDFGGGLHSSDLGLGEKTGYIKEDYGARESNFRITLSNKDSDSTGGRRLGEPEPGTGGRLGQELLNAWDYRTLPNKMLELVKNMGNMKQEGTGYFADSESEMLTVLAYLNYGETTGTTESMREQIDEACKTLENRVLNERDDADRYK